MSPESSFNPPSEAETALGTWPPRLPLSTAETLVTFPKPSPINTAETTAKVDHLKPKERTFVSAIEEKLKKEFGKEATGHDYEHLNRVRNTAIFIAKRTTGANLFIVETAALLHDWKDKKIKGQESRPSVNEFLTSLNSELELDIDQSTITTINNITENIGYTKPNKIPWEGTDTDTYINGRIAEDADRLDAIGAIGTGRTYTFGGSTKKEDINATTRYFYRKPIDFKGKMNTDIAKQMAEERHAFMDNFLDLMCLEKFIIENSDGHLDTVKNLGATGIAKGFAETGKKGIPMHNSIPNIREAMRSTSKSLEKSEEIYDGYSRLLYMSKFLRQLSKEEQEEIE